MNISVDNLIYIFQLFQRILKEVKPRFLSDWLKKVDSTTYSAIIRDILLKCKKATFESSDLRNDDEYDCDKVFNHFSAVIGTSAHKTSCTWEFHPDHFPAPVVFDSVLLLFKTAYANFNNQELSFERRNSLFGIPFLGVNGTRFKICDGSEFVDANLGWRMTPGGGGHSGTSMWQGKVRMWIPGKDAGIQLSRISLLLRLIGGPHCLPKVRPTDLFIDPSRFHSSSPVILGLLDRNIEDRAFLVAFNECAAIYRHFTRTILHSYQFPHSHFEKYRSRFNVTGELEYCQECDSLSCEKCPIDKWVKSILVHSLDMISQLMGPPYPISLSTMFSTDTSLSFVRRDCVRPENNSTGYRVRGNRSIIYSEELFF